ncbi:hypothetical protein GCM10010123_21010 [Pilimelia anulata]|uniref:Uncharacterized protein n=1 Tax=Pilimelia anulata TaxID=53371 RepID=A0A8J3B5D4_9ACTN|nr:ABC transporter permease subunit [Pilimelia anulata]GGJ90939.1 hypothetical protein GCM10010123_21010 [Pilimelia anulata]
MRLLRAEASRFAKRRLVRWGVLGLLAALALVLAGVSQQSRPATAAARAAAGAEADRAYAAALAEHRALVERCRADRAAGRAAFAADPDCGVGAEPAREWYTAEGYLPYQLVFAREISAFMLLFTALLALLAVLLAASFIGAEWHSGGLANLLLWRPQRGRVLAAKLTVALAGTLVVGAVAAVLWVGAVWVLARYDGSLAGTTPGVLRSVGLDAARAVGLALFAAAFAFCLASVGRHTAAAFGAVLAVGLVSEVGVRFAVGVLRVPFPDRYLLSTYADAWLGKVTTIRAGDCLDAGCLLLTRDVHWYEALVVFGAGTALAALAAFGTIGRRAIT